MATTNQTNGVASGLAGAAAIIAAVLALLWGAANPQGNPVQPKPTTTTTSTTVPKTTTTTSTTTSTTTTTMTTVPATPVRRAGADTASWNTPAAVMGASTELAPFGLRWFNYAGGADVPGAVNVAFKEYSIPFYDVREATTRVRVLQTTWSQSLYTTPLPNGSWIPWNPNWKPGTGNDNLMIIIDYEKGQTWEVGGVGQLPINCIDGLGPNFQVGYNFFTMNESQWLCSTGGAFNDKFYTVTDGTTTDGRGAGFNKYIGIVRADEVKSGVIRHPLAMTITRTSFGPACTPGGDYTVVGFAVTCGGYVKPATKLERINPNIGCEAQIVNDVERAKNTPEGMRFALRITDQEIEQWLDSQKYTGPLRNTARIFAVALRDYGWIISETGCYGMHIETEGLVGPARATWASLGITDDGTTYPGGSLIRSGLFTKERVYVVNPPK